MTENKATLAALHSRNDAAHTSHKTHNEVEYLLKSYIDIFSIVLTFQDVSFKLAGIYFLKSKEIVKYDTQFFLKNNHLKGKSVLPQCDLQPTGNKSGSFNLPKDQLGL